MSRWRQPLLAVVILVVAGALAGMVWEALWEPPSGIAYQGQWLLDTTGMPEEFDGTGLYLMVSLGAGLLAGLVIAWVLDRDPLLTMAASLVGACLAAWVMYAVGTAIGPPDPAPIAADAPDGTAIPGAVTVHGRAPFLGFPLATMLTSMVVNLMFTHPETEPGQGRHRRDA